MPSKTRVLKHRRRDAFSRLTERDLRVLQMVYETGALSVPAVSSTFWLSLKQDKVAAACRRRVQLLKEWKVLRYRLYYPNLPIALDYGESIRLPIPTLTMGSLGVQALQGSGYAFAGRPFLQPSRVTPQPSQLAHAVQLGDLLLHILGPSLARYRWWADSGVRAMFAGERTQEGLPALFAPTTVFGRQQPWQLIPDGVISGTRGTWLLEIDRATIWWGALHKRWEESGPILSTVQRAGLIEGSMPLTPLAGVLWFCSAATGPRLYRRMVQLRESLAFALPATLAWYVDTYLGLRRTWDRWLGPWTAGQAVSPTERFRAALEQAAPGAAGQVLALAALGNLTVWQQVREWATRRARLRFGQDLEPWCAVLVRDRREARQLWRAIARLDAADYLLLILDEGEEAEQLSFGRALWSPLQSREEPVKPQWRRVGLQDRVMNWAMGEPDGEDGGDDDQAL